MKGENWNLDNSDFHNDIQLCCIVDHHISLLYIERSVYWHKLRMSGTSTKPKHIAA